MIHSLINQIVQDMIQIKEQVGATYKFSSTQISCPRNIAEKVLAFSMKIPDDKIYTDPTDASLGRELEPHITIKYGLETIHPQDVEEVVDGQTNSISILLRLISLFEPDGKPYDVLKIDVESEDLLKLNGIISKLPCTDTHPVYKPHLTIAYIKKGTGAEYVGNDTFDGVTFEEDCFYFKGRDGSSKKIDLKAIPFDTDAMNRASNQFLTKPPESNPIKGQDALPNFQSQ